MMLRQTSFLDCFMKRRLQENCEVACTCHCFPGQVRTNFSALWLLSTRAPDVIAQRLQDCGVTQTQSGGYRCICGTVFGKQDRDSCVQCWLQHGRATLAATVEEHLPASSEAGVGGEWLAEGQPCPSCGSTAGGWLCAGPDGHIASCEEADVFDGCWHMSCTAATGFLIVDRRRHCVHPDHHFHVVRGDAGLCNIRRHLNAHKAAAEHYMCRMRNFQRRLRREKQPVLQHAMVAKPGPRQREFQSRLRAFQRIQEMLPAGDLLQHMVQSSNERLSVAVEHEKCLRHGSVLLPPSKADGKVILKINTREKRVLTAKVEHNDQCSRHPKCLCYRICEHEQQWISMQEAKGCTVVCLTPRFGWRYDFTLPLSKVCWRLADVVGKVDEKIAALRAQLPCTQQASDRCAKLLNMCRATTSVSFEEWQAMR